MVWTLLRKCVYSMPCFSMCLFNKAVPLSFQWWVLQLTAQWAATQRRRRGERQHIIISTGIVNKNRNTPTRRGIWRFINAMIWCCVGQFSRQHVVPLSWTWHTVESGQGTPSVFTVFRSENNNINTIKIINFNSQAVNYVIMTRNSPEITINCVINSFEHDILWNRPSGCFLTLRLFLDMQLIVISCLFHDMIMEITTYKLNGQLFVFFFLLNPFLDLCKLVLHL